MRQALRQGKKIITWSGQIYSPGIIWWTLCCQTQIIISLLFSKFNHKMITPYNYFSINRSLRWQINQTPNRFSTLVFSICIKKQKSELENFVFSYYIIFLAHLLLISLMFDFQFIFIFYKLNNKLCFLAIVYTQWNWVFALLTNPSDWVMTWIKQ